MRTPTASAVRAAQAGSRFRAAFTPSTIAPIISSSPMPAAPGRVVRIRDVDAHRPDCQGESDEGGRLHVVRHSGDHIHHCDREPAAKSSPNRERAMRFEGNAADSAPEEGSAQYKGSVRDGAPDSYHRFHGRRENDRPG